MKSKIIKKIFTIGLLFGFLSSCDYLDVTNELAGGITDISQVFNNVDRTKKWYGQVFDNVPDYSRMWATHGMGNIWSFYADELFSRIANNSGKYTEWNSSNTDANRWYPLYESIRQANIFLERAKPIVDEGGPNAARLTEPEVERYKANVRFMRAAYYFYLMELYGPVPIVTQSLTLQDELDLPRNTLDELINFIDTELLEAMAGMEQEPYHNNESYRAVPTKGTALALRAKLWAYAASPLFNGGFTEALQLKNKDEDGTRLFPDYDAGKLQKAVDASKDFIEYAEGNGGRYELYKNVGTFSPELSVYEVFQDYNREIIWATAKSQWGALGDQNFVSMVTPRSENKGLG
ncbi:MAG: RagB/SusD family nutrient uptake outer membrane protein, partial [Dysgonamonadaceae bacterium]|nr:RagB/SusD family nutrient uptake outer membrane protein [Dysgonamonadaceae bacterium]